uniref:Chromo domain-containing protein n=1 Tax=Passalora fulva TaxID=5499 RepID=A0A9Q8US77_PASFU
MPGPPDEVEVDEPVNLPSDDYAVRKIRGIRVEPNDVEGLPPIKYEVEWQGCPKWDTLWEPIQHIIFNRQAIEEYHARADGPEVNIGRLFESELFDGAYQWCIDHDIRPRPGTEAEHPRYVELLRLRRNSALFGGATVMVSPQSVQKVGTEEPQSAQKSSRSDSPAWCVSAKNHMPRNIRYGTQPSKFTPLPNLDRFTSARDCVTHGTPASTRDCAGPWKKHVEDSERRAG